MNNNRLIKVTYDHALSAYNKCCQNDERELVRVLMACIRLQG
jgi:hypothetical protein